MSQQDLYARAIIGSGDSRRKKLIIVTALTALLLIVSALSSACFESKSEASGQNSSPNSTATANPDKAAVINPAVPDDGLQLVYDPTIDSKPVKISPASVAFIKRTLEPKLKEMWNSDVCTGDFKILAAANGSFTASGTVQTAYLYEYCRKESVLVKDGIAIFQDSKLVENIAFSSPEIAEDENIAYDDGYAFEMTGLHDINGNGVDELVVSYSIYEGGIFNTSIDLLEVRQSTVNVIGSTETYAFHNSAGEGFRITVKSGKTPVFYSETIKQNNNKWTKKGVSKPVKLDHSEVNKYQIVS